MKNKLIVSIDIEDWYHGPSVISPIESEQKSLQSLLDSKRDIERAYLYIESCLEILKMIR